VGECGAWVQDGMIQHHAELSMGRDFMVSFARSCRPLKVRMVELCNTKKSSTSQARKMNDTLQLEKSLDMSWFRIALGSVNVG
jgi:hypothetical protein